MKTVNITDTEGSQGATTPGEFNGIRRYWGSDPALRTQVGERIDQAMQTTGRAGFLVFGPYVPFDAGTYQLTVKGTAQGTTTGCWLDVACDAGVRRVIRVDLPEVNANSEWTLTTEFVLEFSVKTLETRVWVPDSAKLAVMSIAITPDLQTLPLLQGTLNTKEPVAAAPPAFKKQNKKVKRR